jgi:hypothetical protein
LKIVNLKLQIDELRAKPALDLAVPEATPWGSGGDERTPKSLARYVTNCPHSGNALFGILGFRMVPTDGWAIPRRKRDWVSISRPAKIFSMPTRKQTTLHELHVALPGQKRQAGTLIYTNKHQLSVGHSIPRWQLVFGSVY